MGQYTQLRLQIKILKLILHTRQLGCARCGCKKYIVVQKPCSRRAPSSRTTCCFRQMLRLDWILYIWTLNILGLFTRNNDDQESWLFIGKLEGTHGSAWNISLNYTSLEVKGRVYGKKYHLEKILIGDW